MFDIKKLCVSIDGKVCAVFFPENKSEIVNFDHSSLSEGDRPFCLSLSDQSAAEHPKARPALPPDGLVNKTSSLRPDILQGFRV